MKISFYYQVSPQSVRLVASPGLGAPQVDFSVALSDRPVDIYFVMDLSGSMSQHKVWLVWEVKGSTWIARAEKSGCHGRFDCRTHLSSDEQLPAGLRLLLGQAHSALRPHRESGSTINQKRKEVRAVISLTCNKI